MELQSKVFIETLDSPVAIEALKKEELPQKEPLLDLLQIPTKTMIKKQLSFHSDSGKAFD